MGKNWFHAAGQIWPVLVDAGVQQKTLTYEHVASILGTNPLSVRYVLDPIQYYCVENRLAPLTVVVVGKASGIPGSGFMAWDVEDLDAAYQAVAAQNWNLVGNPFQGFGPADNEDSYARVLVSDPASAGEVYRRIRDRGIAQRIFRRALLAAYSSKCALCGLSYPDALEAAHLVPWGECRPEERMDVRNGILLCASHHRLLDSEYFSFDPEMTLIYYDPDGEDGPYSEVDKAFALALHGRQPDLPVDARLRPSADFIFRHIELRKASGNK